MQYSVVPEYLNEHRIKFKKLDLIPVNICDTSNKRYISPFKKPFLIINLFAKKTTKPVEIVEISLEELRNFGFAMFSFKVRGNGWFWGQRKKFIIEKKSSHPIGSRKLGNVPPNHMIELDKNNNLVRLKGANAGVKGFGKWMDVKND